MFSVFFIFLATSGIVTSLPVDSTTTSFPWQDWRLPRSIRAQDIINRLNISSKSRQLVSMAPSEPEIELPAFNWRSECCHGWGFTGSDYVGSGWNGTATIFPHVIGLAATFDPSLIRSVGAATGMEGRAAYNEARSKGIRGHMMTGAHCFGPTSDIGSRDPRWGRIKRTWGESSVVSGALHRSYVAGLHGVDAPDPRYRLMLGGTNMFAVHSGPDDIRTHFEANATLAEIHGFYLEGFEIALSEGGATSVMVAYSGLNGIPDNANAELMKTILRDQWEFDGLSFSDNSGVYMLYADQHYAPSTLQAAVMAINAGLQQDMSSGGPGENGGWDYGNSLYQSELPTAVAQGLVNESTIDDALFEVLTLRMSTGDLDPEDVVPWSSIGVDVIGNAQHLALNLRACVESITLLTNSKNILPLSTSLLEKNILVVGPNANTTATLFGGTYAAIPAGPVTTPLQGLEIASKSAGGTVTYVEGCFDVLCPNTTGFAEAIAAAKTADLVVFVGGIDGTEIEAEGKDRGQEDTDWLLGPPCEGKDRDVLGLPGCQQDLVVALKNASSAPLITILLQGGPVSTINVSQHSDAILSMYYPGSMAGEALTKVLFGEESPSGRLPYTVFSNAALAVPQFVNYSHVGRTYRFTTASQRPYIEYPFGFGLSYASFTLSKPVISASPTYACGLWNVSITISHIQGPESDVVLQVYLENHASTAPGSLVSPTQLAAFSRIHLLPNESITLSFSLTPWQRTVTHSDGTRWIYPDPIGVRFSLQGPTDPQSVVRNITSSFPPVQWDTCGANKQLLSDWWEQPETASKLLQSTLQNLKK